MKALSFMDLLTDSHESNNENIIDAHQVLRFSENISKNFLSLSQNELKEAGIALIQESEKASEYLFHISNGDSFKRFCKVNKHFLKNRLLKLSKIFLRTSKNFMIQITFLSQMKLDKVSKSYY